MSMADLTGQRFGRLVVVSPAERRGERVMWSCLCDCGSIKVSARADLRSGSAKSCGCLRAELHAERMSKAHERSVASGRKSDLYGIWTGMKHRCSSVKKGGVRYQDRGIKVCSRWEASFDAFREDVGERPSKQHSLDRINNAGDYEPGNVRWATSKTQAGNRGNNVLVTFNGETLCAAEWSRRYGLPLGTVNSRTQKGWTAEKAITTPHQGVFYPRGTELTFNGETLSREEWAERIGISYVTLTWRLRTWGAEKALGESRKNALTYQGRTMSVSAWSRELGMSSSTLGTRIKRWGVERAITEPVSVGHRRFFGDGIKASLSAGGTTTGVANK